MNGFVFADGIASPFGGKETDGLALGDIDGDGDLDVVANSIDPESGASLPFLVVGRGNANGTFAVNMTGTIWAFRESAFADLDPDGDLDLVALTSNSIFHLRNHGTGTLNGGNTVNDPTLMGGSSISPQRLVVADFDGDGDRDVVGYGATSGHFAAFPILGAGAFGDAIFHRVGVFAAGYPIRKGPLFADADGDGRFDAIAVAGSTQLHDEIVVLPGACAGRSVGFGHGCAGSGGFTPRIALVGIPCVGNVVGFELRDGLGGSFALVFLGAGETVMPITGGCDLLIAPLLPYAFAIPLSGIGAGQGKVAVTTFLPPSIDGAELTLQAFVAEPTLAGGASASAGLAARFQD